MDVPAMESFTPLCLSSDEPLALYAPVMKCLVALLVVNLPLCFLLYFASIKSVPWSLSVSALAGLCCGNTVEFALTGGLLL